MAHKTPQELREYQQVLLNKILAVWAEPILDKQTGILRYLKPAVNVATGGGKTTIFAELLARLLDPNTERALIYVHTQEIIYQIRDRVWAQTPKVDYWHVIEGKARPGIGLVAGNDYQPDARIVVASRQMLQNPKHIQEILKYGRIDYLILDEAHHFAAGNTNDAIFKVVLDHNPLCKVSGYSATLKRNDKAPLAAGFDKIVGNWTVENGIELGFLVPPTVLEAVTSVDITAAKTEEKIISMVKAANWDELVLKAYRDYLQNTRKHTIAFLPTVQMSMQFVDQLNKSGVKAMHLDGDTPKRPPNYQRNRKRDVIYREDILEWFAQGDYQVLSNYNVLTEGFDAPITDSILQGRPTKSEVVLTQIIGRGLRLYPGKTDCLVLDVAAKGGITLFSEGMLTGKNITCWNCGAIYYKGFSCCPQCGAPVVDPKNKKKSLGGGVGYRDDLDLESGDITKITVTDKTASLFDRLAAAWFSDSLGNRSIGIGINAGALVILPPTNEDPQPLRARYTLGTKYLAKDDITNEDRESAIDALDTLQRQIDRTQKYELIYIPDRSDTTSKPATLAVNTDVADLVRSAGSLALKHVGQTLAKMLTAMHSKSASDAQMSFLSRLGYVTSEKISSAKANQLITHFVNVPKAEKYRESDYLEPLEVS